MKTRLILLLVSVSLAVMFGTGTLGIGLAEREAALRADANNLRLGSEYRQAVIQCADYDRALQFFDRLTAENAHAANAWLNYGFAYVDKIPSAGSITQVILANNALAQFTKAIEVSPSWLAYYTRGNSYLYWPKVFGRAPLGVSDLEHAMSLQEKSRRHAYYVRGYISLGDGYWKTDELEKAKTVWRAGLAEFPDNVQLKTRLANEDDALRAVIENALDPHKRVDTDLKEIWAEK